jgi:leukotriene-A4 hydrolase
MADPTTQSNYLQIASEHVYLDWSIDFDKRFITGYAVHHFLVKKIDVKQVM